MLALAAGALLPVTVVETIGQVAYIGQWLESLHRRGLAEQRDDRFGLPACKAQGYRQMLFKDLHLAASARALSTWLTAADPTAADCQSAAEAAIAIMEFAAERGDWTTVIRLARAAERVLFIAGRWDAWHHTLSQGLEAARAAADKAAGALFSHQQGTLAFCQDQLDDARLLLQQALTLREQVGDDVGAEISRHNLRLLEPPEMPRPPRPRVPHRVLVLAGSVLTTLALAAGTVAIAGALRAGSPPGHPTTASSSAGHPTTTSSSAGHPANTSSSSSQPTSSRALSPQMIRFTSTPPNPGVPGGTSDVTASGGGSGNPVIFSIDPASGAVCTISGVRKAVKAVV